MLSGASLTVSSGGTANGVTVDLGGWLTILAGDYVNGTIDSGTVVVSSGGMEFDDTLNSGGALLISSGGSESGATLLSGAALAVSDGAVVTFIDIVAGADPHPEGGRVFLFQFQFRSRYRKLRRNK